MPERVITMTRGVIKDINSGRRGATRRKKEKKAGRERQSGEKRWGMGTKINTLLYAALRLRPVTAPDSLSKDFNRQQTN